MFRFVQKRFFSVTPDAVKSKIALPPPQLLINGKFVNSITGKTFDTINPVDETVITKVAEASREDVNIAVRAAREAFETGPWSRTSGYQRSILLNRFADLIEKNRKHLAEIEVLDNGKSFFEAFHVDLPLVIQTIRYYAGWADKIQGKTINLGGPLAGPLGDAQHLAYTRHEPIGVCGQIIPWNFPLLMAAWKLAPALAAGNCVVLKVAEQTPLSALRLGELIMEAGFPPGVVNILTGDGPVAGAALAEHPDVDKIAFTGSTEVGKLVGVAAFKSNLKRVTLELGGKSPNIIFKDADIDAAVDGAHLGLFLNQGQCCVAGSRLYVESAVYDEVVEKSVKLAKSRVVGDPFKDNTRQGPQVSQEQLDTVMRYIESGKKEGAKLETGGARVGNKGYFVQPTVFTNVTDNMTIAREEIFGPVMSIMKFESEEELIKKANNTQYGLAAGVWTKDAGKAHRVAAKIRAGSVWINSYDVFDASVPFGGFKQSGLGRELGEYGLNAYTEVKAIVQRL